MAGPSLYVQCDFAIVELARDESVTPALPKLILRLLYFALCIPSDKQTDLGTPRADVCPAAGDGAAGDGEVISTDTEIPTIPPAEAPTMVPSLAVMPPTMEPTVSDVITRPPKRTSEPTMAETDEPTLSPTAPEQPPMKPTKGPKDSGKKPDDETDSPTSAPTILPAMKETKKPTAAVAKESEAPNIDMSFSYAYFSEDEDMEWGREEEDKTDKVAKKAKDEEEIRGKVRVGQRRIR
jgi:hypothetical protein